MLLEFGGEGRSPREIGSEVSLKTPAPDIRSPRSSARGVTPLDAAAPNRIVIKSISPKQRPRRPA